MSLYNGEASIVCPSVCLSVRLSVNFCSNRFFSQANSRIATKLSQDGLQVNVHPGSAQGQGKGHVIRALLCWHENRFFSQANGPIATKLAHDGLRVSVHPGCAQGQGQRSRDTRTFLDSWNELLRHWRSGCVVFVRFRLVIRQPSYWFCFVISFQEWAYAMARRPSSVCPSVCL